MGIDMLFGFQIDSRNEESWKHHQNSHDSTMNMDVQDPQVPRLWCARAPPRRTDARATDLPTGVPPVTSTRHMKEGFITTTMLCCVHVMSLAQVIKVDKVVLDWRGTRKCEFDEHAAGPRPDFGDLGTLGLAALTATVPALPWS